MTADTKSRVEARQFEIIEAEGAELVVLARDLDTVSLGELYEGMGLRIPTIDLALPGRLDTLGRAAERALDHLRQPLQDPMQRSVASFMKTPKDS